MKWLDKYQNNKPTTQDSLDLLNNSKSVRDYYLKSPKYKEVHDFKDQNNYTENTHETNEMILNRLIYNPFVNRYKKGNIFVQSQNISIDDYYKKLDENKYLQREKANAILDLNAPMTLYDKRIEPRSIQQFINIDSKDDLFRDEINFVNYPKLQVTPINQLTIPERIERQKLYGVNPGETNYIKRKNSTKSLKNLPYIKPEISSSLSTDNLNKIGMISSQKNLFDKLKMRSLWANSVKANPNYKIGTLNPLEYNDDTKGFTINEAINFPQEIKDKYNIDYIGKQIGIKKNGGWLSKYENGGDLPTANTLKNALGNVRKYFFNTEDSNLLESKYRPTIGDEGNIKYYTRKGMKEDVYKDFISPKVMKDYNQNGTFSDIHKALINNGKDRVNNANESFPLNKAGYKGMYNKGHGSFKGEFNLGRYRTDAGQDEMGKYISFYDIYDWNGAANSKSNNPIHYYDRIYEDDWSKFKNNVDAISYENGGIIPKAKDGEKAKKTIKVFAESPYYDYPKYGYVSNDLTKQEYNKLPQKLKDLRKEYEKLYTPELKDIAEKWIDANDILSEITERFNPDITGVSHDELMATNPEYREKILSYTEINDRYDKIYPTNEFRKISDIYDDRNYNPMTKIQYQDFIKEGNNLKKAFSKDSTINVDVIPLYGEADTTKIKQNLQGLTPNDDIVIMGHNGPQFAGIKNEWWDNTIKDSPACKYLGACSAEETVKKGFKNNNIIYRPNDGWLGVNPKANNMIDAMYSRFESTDGDSKRTPIKGVDYNISNEYKNGGKLINFTKPTANNWLSKYE